MEDIVGVLPNSSMGRYDVILIDFGKLTGINAGIGCLGYEQHAFLFGILDFAFFKAVIEGPENATEGASGRDSETVRV